MTTEKIEENSEYIRVSKIGAVKCVCKINIEKEIY